MEKTVNIVYLYFTKAFDTISHCILLEKLTAHGLAWCYLLGKKLAAWQGPERGGEWCCIQLVTCHLWCSSLLSTGASPV